jgi:hypothetical protein
MSVRTFVSQWTFVQDDKKERPVTAADRLSAMPEGLSVEISPAWHFERKEGAA